MLGLTAGGLARTPNHEKVSEKNHFPVDYFRRLLPGLSSGHIPGSISLPFPELLDPVSKALLPKQELRKIFEAKGIDPGMPIVSSCGTGVTAAIIDAALDEAEFGDPNKRRLYDGSWT
jgi:thiosulfate/3-mercaptopyruvate sulfurtransferase